MKILSYNIHGGIGTDKVKDYKRIFDFIYAQGADIVFLQEVESRSRKNGHIDDLKDFQQSPYDYYATGPTYEDEDEDSHGWYGNMIISRFPIVKQYSHNISVPLRSKRCVLEVLIDTPVGELACINTHFGLSGVERRLQARALLSILEKLKGQPVVAMGDFNQWHPFAPMQRVLSQALAPHHVGATFPSRFPFLHLDRAWSWPQDLIESMHVLKTKESRVFSDHLPIVAEINTSSSQLTQPG